LFPAHVPCKGQRSVLGPFVSSFLNPLFFPLLCRLAIKDLSVTMSLAQPQFCTPCLPPPDHKLSFIEGPIMLSVLPHSLPQSCNPFTFSPRIELNLFPDSMTTAPFSAGCPSFSCSRGPEIKNSPPCSCAVGSEFAICSVRLFSVAFFQLTPEFHPEYSPANRSFFFPVLRPTTLLQLCVAARRIIFVWFPGVPTSAQPFFRDSSWRLFHRAFLPFGQPFAISFDSPGLPPGLLTAS